MTRSFHPDTTPKEFHPVIDIRGDYNVLDLTRGYYPASISLDPPSIGRYHEKRHNMYTFGLYEGRRDIHMGIDFWVPSGTPVHAFSDGRILCFRDNDKPGDYGPTIVTEHLIAGDLKGNSANTSEEHVIYALFGHLSRASLHNISEGMPLKRGEAFASVGDEQENGGWVPHLHFQLSRVRPEQPDMPGVVAEEDLTDALQIYPDPQLVTGRFY